MTPGNMDRPHSTLAVAWGPLIQIIVMIDHEEREKPFVLDGYYILRQIKLAAPIADLTQAALLKKATQGNEVQANLNKAIEEEAKSEKHPLE